ncbi:MAG: DUF4911 domain-containing protein [Bdellovibrionales bacterium]|nr:DUF4911 domain-containing protein [Bdellovibrionales bacterium]
MNFVPQQIDQETWAYYLEVPGSLVVLLQAYFESYEGLGTVRTLDIRKSLVCILTTSSLRELCGRALESIAGQIDIKSVGKPAEAEKYLGYFKRA